MLSWPPPVNPISVCAASPGPLTTHPIIDKLIGFVICDNLFSNSLTVSMTGKACLAQEGQEIILTPLDLIPIDLIFQNLLLPHQPDLRIEKLELYRQFLALKVVQFQLKI